jgi:hypothetical protein
MSKFTINDLDINEVNTLIGGLLELPGKVGINLYMKVRQQVEDQARAQQAAEGAPQGPLADKVVQ